MRENGVETHMRSTQQTQETQQVAHRYNTRNSNRGSHNQNGVDVETW